MPMETALPVIALAGSWVLTLILGAVLVPLLARRRVGQRVRAEGPRSHLAKAGTPTMGGLVFIVPSVIMTVLLAPRAGPGWVAVITVLAVALGHAGIGFADDFLKVVLRRSLGLRARAKLFYGLILGLALAWVAADVLGYGTAVPLPWTGRPLELGTLYYPFVVFIVLGTSNAVNLTDGVDGLLSGAAFVGFGFYAWLLAGRGHTGLAVAAAAIVGGCGGFLRYNAFPARVFMGDTGSLFLGGALAAVAILTKTELLLPIVGLLFVVEALSVIVQVISFRLRGRRVFRMSPLHHHFELAGWQETRVARGFWLVALVGAVLAWSAAG